MSLESCPSAELLELYAVGETDDGGIGPHLVVCESCRGAFKRLRDNNNLLAEVAAAATRDRTPRAGHSATSIPGYRIVEDIGAGGQGVVYKAVQLATKRTVALKVLLGGSFAEPRRRERFEREIEVVASLNHPSIVTIFDSGTTPDGRRYFAMEYIAGKPLLDYVRGTPHHRRRGRPRPAKRPIAESATESSASLPPPSAAPIELRERLKLFAQICDALSAPHLRGIVHRDLKPANLLIDASGAPHILDFGLAKVLGDDPLSGGATPTISGEFMGTFAYAAPEQLRGRPELIDIRTDVYALGVVLYELLTDRPPYTLGAAIGDAIRTITESEPPRPSTVRAGVGDELDTIALKALSKEPERRYQSAGDLARDVQRFLAGEPIDAKRDSTWYMLRKAARKHRAVVLAGGAVLVLLLLFAIGMTMLARSVELQRQRADESAGGLAQSLTQANIERGRLMTEIGNILVAERLLWREYLTQPADSPAGRQAYWALWELYSREPCLATFATSYEFGGALQWMNSSELIGLDRVGRVECWDARSLTRTAALRLEGVAAEPPYVFLGASGARAVQRCRNEARLWEMPTGRPGPRIPIGNPGPDTPLAISADGTRIAGALDGERLALFAAADGRLIDSTESHPELVCELQRLAFSPDGEFLISVERGGAVGVWNLRSGDFRSGWMGAHGPPATALAVSPDSRRIALAGDYGGYGLRLYDVATDSHDATASWKGGSASHLCFSPDGRRLASASSDRMIRVWDADDCRLLTVLRGSPTQATALQYDESGRVIASGFSEGSVKLWDVRGAARVRFEPGTQFVSALAFTPDGRELLTGADFRGRLSAHDVRSGALLRSYSEANASNNGLACAPDGGIVAVARMDGTILVSDLRSARELCVFHDPEKKRAHDVAVHPGGRFVASGHDDGYVRLWDARERAYVGDFVGQKARIPNLRYSPDGRMLAAAGADGRIVVWDAETRTVLHDLAASSAAERALAFSPDSRMFASGGDDGALKLWDAASGRRLATLEAHQHDVFTIAFSPDGRLIASGDRGGVIMLWDVVSRRNLVKIVQHSDMVFGVTFSPDSRYLASGSRDKSAVVLDLAYFDTHIAGNLAFQRARLEADVAASIDRVADDALRARAREKWRRASEWLGAAP